MPETLLSENFTLSSWRIGRSKRRSVDTGTPVQQRKFFNALKLKVAYRLRYYSARAKADLDFMGWFEKYHYHERIHSSIG